MIPLSLLIGFLSSFLAVFILQIFHDQFDFEQVMSLFNYKTPLIFLQSGVVFLVFLLISFILGSTWISSLMIIMLSFLLGIGTQQKNVYRGEPVYPSDGYFLKDFSFVIEMVKPGIVILMVFILMIIMGLIAFLFTKQYKNGVLKKTFIIRIIGILVVSWALFYVGQFNQPGNAVREKFDETTYWITFSQDINYTNNGVVSGLLYNLKSPAIEKPNDYSKEKMKEIYNKYSKKAEQINEERNGSLEDVNVIYVMNESFSDPSRIEGISITGGDALEKYRLIEKKHTHGQTLSQSYGGGTANIEFEALTGISLEPLSGNITTPFIQMNYQMKTLPTIVDYMKESNHELTSIHPHGTTMYKRVQNYEALGFENRIFVDDLTYADTIDDNYYVSDKAAYKELLDVIKGSEQRDFVHLLTMQNHKPTGNYEGKYKNVEYKVKGSTVDGDIEHYLKGMSYSSEAIDYLINELDEWDEKTILVFWGDHLPSLYSNELYTSNGHLLMHQTPLLIYSNFKNDNRDINTLSPIYFLNHVLKMTGTEVTPFTALLSNMEEVLPAFEKGFYMESENEFKKKREELELSTQELLHDYDLILYDITTGNNYSKEMEIY